MLRVLLVVVALLAVSAAGVLALGGVRPSGGPVERAASSPGALSIPVDFQENLGQAPTEVRYVGRTPQGSLQASNKQNVEKLQDECLTNVRKRDECIEEIQASKKDTEEMELDLG